MHGVRLADCCVHRRSSLGWSSCRPEAYVQGCTARLSACDIAVSRPTQRLQGASTGHAPTHTRTHTHTPPPAPTHTCCSTTARATQKYQRWKTTIRHCTNQCKGKHTYSSTPGAHRHLGGPWCCTTTLEAPDRQALSAKHCCGNQQPVHTWSHRSTGLSRPASCRCHPCATGPA